MKKKLFIGTVLPTVAALGVIGSGFSLWIFSDSNHVETTGSVGIDVTKVLSIKDSTITVANGDAKLVFDQTENTSVDPKNPNGEGLHFDKMQTATYASKEGLDSYVVDWADNVKLTFTTTIFLPTNIAKHINLENNGLSGDFGTKTTVSSYTPEGTTSDLGAGSTYTYTIDSTSITDSSSWTSGNVSYQMFDFSKVTPSYVNEPDTLAEYKQMREDLGIDSTALKISVSYAVKAEIVSKN